MSLTLGAARRVRSLLKVDLLRLLEPRAEGGAPLLTELETDADLLVEVVYALVKPQADDAGISGEAFAELIDGDVFADFYSGFLEELRFFSRGLPRGRVIAAAMDKHEEIVRTHVDQATATIVGMTTPGMSSTNSPEA